MWPLQSTSLAWTSLALGLLILASPPNVEATSLTTSAFASTQSGISEPGCNLNDSGTSNASASCGQFSGDSLAEAMARASFDSLGVKVSTSISIPAFQIGATLLGTYLAEGRAQAKSSDSLTITPIDPNVTSGIVAFGFALDGSLNFFEEGPQDFTDLFTSITLTVVNATNGAYQKQIGRSFLPPESGELTFLLPYTTSIPLGLDIELLAVSSCGRGSNLTGKGPGPGSDYNCMNSADFFSSATITSLEVRNESGQAVDAGVTSLSGHVYPTGSAPNPIPEPSTMILFGSGLAGLIGWRWKSRKTA